ncbi:MAG: hypothetical protein RIC95_05375 [Vicingaceae bacterium]
MTKTSRFVQTENKELGFYFIFSALFVLFLFFIDEGRFSLEGLISIGGMAVFLAYFLPIFFAQLGLSKLLQNIIKGQALRIIFCLLVGTILGLALTLGFFLGFFGMLF